jgi:hypothetical protein
MTADLADLGLGLDADGKLVRVRPRTEREALEVAAGSEATRLLLYDLQEGRHPTPSELADLLRRFLPNDAPIGYWAGLPGYVVAYVAGRLDGTVRPPKNRRPPGFWKSKERQFLHEEVRRQVERRHGAYKALRVDRPLEKPRWPPRVRPHLRWRPSRGRYKLEQPRELAIRRVAHRFTMSPDTVRDVLKERA